MRAANKTVKKILIGIVAAWLLVALMAALGGAVMLVICLINGSHPILAGAFVTTAFGAVMGALDATV